MNHDLRSQEHRRVDGRGRKTNSSDDGYETENVKAVTLEDAAAKAKMGLKCHPGQRLTYSLCVLTAERATTLALLVGGRNYPPKRGNGEPWTGNTRSSSQDIAETDSGGEIRPCRSNRLNASRQTVRGSLEGRTARSRCAMPNSQHEPDGGNPPERAVQHGAVSANAFPTRRAGEDTSSARVQPSDDARIDCYLSRATGQWTGARGERRNKSQLATTPVR